MLTREEATDAAVAYLFGELGLTEELWREVLPGLLETVGWDELVRERDRARRLAVRLGRQLRRWIGRLRTEGTWEADHEDRAVLRALLEERRSW